MKSGSTSPPNGQKITLLVFKDNYAARTFQIPLKWISRLGLIIGLCIGVTVLALFFTAKYFQLRSDTQNPDQSLTSNAFIEEKLENTPAPLMTGVPNANISNIFLPFSKMIQTDTVNSPLSGVAIESLKVFWSQDILKVQFSLHYSHNDHGHRQGRILIVARGPGQFLVYPSVALNPLNGQALIGPEYGEIFSVSKFREVKTEFGPVNAPNGLQGLEIFILNKSGTQLFLYRRIVLPPQKPEAETDVNQELKETNEPKGH